MMRYYAIFVKMGYNQTQKKLDIDNRVGYGIIM